MKTPVILIILTCGAGLPLSANDEVSPDVAGIGMLPKQRTAQRLAPNERNPFAFKPKETAKAVVEETETQESKIRAIFKSMSVTGVRRGSDGRLMALVGDLILREGEEVKPVLVDQTELLLVSRIDPKRVELTFVENKDSTQPRTIPLPITTQTRVAQRLAGQPHGSKAMYYPSAKAAAAGVAAVMSAAGGSGAVSATQSEVGETGEPAEMVAVSGIGAITAPPPSTSVVDRAERMSFAALAPTGRINSPNTAAAVPSAAGSRLKTEFTPVPSAKGPVPSSSPPAPEPPSPAAQPTPAIPPKTPAPSIPVAPQPINVESAPPSDAPQPALPGALSPAPAKAAPPAIPNSPATPAPVTSKPTSIRLAVPPPPASKAPPVVE